MKRKDPVFDAMGMLAFSIAIALDSAQRARIERTLMMFSSADSIPPETAQLLRRLAVAVRGADQEHLQAAAKGDQPN